MFSFFLSPAFKPAALKQIFQVCWNWLFKLIVPLWHHKGSWCISQVSAEVSLGQVSQSPNKAA